LIGLGMAQGAFSAIVFGPTGAIGREVVRELVGSDKWIKVVAVSRRELPRENWVEIFPNIDLSAAASKLEVQIVNFQNLEGEIGQIVEGKNAVFYCLGTTRRDAGSLERFREIDLGYTSSIARICRAANIPSFSLVSTVGANSQSIFGYFQTKGEIEDFVRSLNFERCQIWRPGLLQRKDKARFVEKISSFFTFAQPVDSVGKAMRLEAELALEQKSSFFRIYENNDITNIARN